MTRRMTFAASLSVLFLTLIGCGVPASLVNASGQTGPAGPAGPAGIIFENSYDAKTPYVYSDVVTYAGSTYFALAPSTGVTPGIAGNPPSQADWALLAAKGQDGAVGATGQVGPTGPAGPQGIPGPVGATGAAGLTGPAGQTGPTGPMGPAGAVGPAGPAGPQGIQGVAGAAGAMGLTGPAGVPGPAGAVGATGPQGVAGPQGAPGEAGVAGPKGEQGVAGPTGAQGPAGPQGIPGVAPASIWNGRRVAVFGDSYTSANFWQNSVLSYHNLTQVFQDAIPGRATGSIFTCYSGSTPQTLVNTGSCGGYNTGKQGTTLASNLGDPDLILIALGANDFAEPLGAASDTSHDATFHGYIKNALETLVALVPTARIVWVTPPAIPNPDRASAIAGIVHAIQEESEIYSYPVVNMLTDLGISKLNWSSYGNADLTHLNPDSYSNVYGPMIDLHLNSIRPLR